MNEKLSKFEFVKIPAEKVALFKKWRQWGFPKIVCASGCGMHRMPGRLRPPHSVRGNFFGELYPHEDLPEARAMLKAEDSRRHSVEAIRDRIEDEERRMFGSKI